jgi:hypothetical protein
MLGLVLIRVREKVSVRGQREKLGREVITLSLIFQFINLNPKPNPNPNPNPDPTEMRVRDEG